MMMMMGLSYFSTVLEWEYQQFTQLSLLTARAWVFLPSLSWLEQFAVYQTNQLLSGVMQGQGCPADKVPRLLCHLRVAGDKWLFMTLSSSSLISDWPDADSNSRLFPERTPCSLTSTGVEIDLSGFQRPGDKRRTMQHFLQLWNNRHMHIL